MKLFVTVRCVVKVTLTFRRRAHHCCLVSMATVTSDKRPAPALAQTVFISTATQALIMEEAGAGAKLRVLQRCANVTGKKRTEKCKSKPSTLKHAHLCFVCFCLFWSYPRPSCLQITLASLSDQ